MLSAQQLPINIEALTDEQLKEYVKQANLSGLSDEELAAKAKEKGLNDAQIAVLKRRIQSLGLASASAQGTASKTTNFNEERLPIGVKPPQSTISSKVFGAELFGNQNLTFEPNLRIATPLNYVLGVGDEVKIEIFGFSEKQITQKISTEGYIRIPLIAPIYLAGLTVEDAGKKIKSSLTKIYPQIATGNTTVQVTVGQIRSIRVTMIGEVTKPGSYMLPSFSTIMNALYVSGGPNAIGSMRSIELVRNGKTKIVFDVYDFLLKADLTKNFRLEDEDIIKINPYKIRVEVAGAIKRPAIFEPRENEKLTNIIQYAGGFTDNAYKEFIKVERFGKTQKEALTINENNFNQFQIQSGDYFKVENIADRIKNRVFIKGAVYFEGDYSLDEIKTLKQLIGKVKLKEEAFLQRGLIKRLQDNYQPLAIAFNLKDILSGKENITLQREDEVSIFSIGQTKESYTVSINGEINNPGTYNLSDSLQVEDLVLMAGGFKESANPRRIEIARRIRDKTYDGDTSQLSIVQIIEINNDLTIAPNKFLLEPYDIISVRKMPQYNPAVNVTVKGQVLYPGNFAIGNRNERISDLIKRSGGLKADAFVEGALLLRKTLNASEDSTVIKSKINILKRAIKDSTERKFADSTLLSQYKLVGINLEECMKNPGSIQDLTIEDGDILSIPVRSRTVQSFGEVQVPRKIIYTTGLNVRELVRLSGGFNSDANKRSLYVIHPNGEVRGTKSFLFFKKFPSLREGSEVYVPVKGDRRKLSSGEIVGLLGFLGTLISTTATILILNRQ